MNRQITILLGLLVVLVGGLALWAQVRLSDAARQATYAAEDLVTSRQNAARIIELRDATGGSDGQPLDIPTRIRHAAVAANIGDAGLTRIEPSPPRPIRNSDYSEVPIPLRVEGLRARQLITFLHVVSQPEVGLNVKRVDMARAGGGSGGETWNADVTLAYFTYTPRATR